jgi:predicted transcriptional regulator YdeE
LQPGNPTRIEAFLLAGITVRTNNLNGQSARDIGQLWADFFAQDLTKKIQGKISGELICAYTEYESDMSGPYTTVLGYRVSPGQEQPAGIVVVEMKASPAVVYESPNAEPGTVLETWKKIWLGGLSRSYQTDYDLYAGDGTVQTFVSVAP